MAPIDELLIYQNNSLKSMQEKLAFKMKMQENHQNNNQQLQLPHTIDESLLREKDDFGIWLPEEGLFDVPDTNNDFDAITSETISDEVKDEIDAILAIYGEENVILDCWPSIVIVKLNIDEWEQSDWVVRFTLPQIYPLQAPKIEMGSPSHFPSEQLDVMVAQALSTAIPDQVMLWDIVESLREQIQRYEDDRADEFAAKLLLKQEADELRKTEQEFLQEQKEVNTQYASNQTTANTEELFKLHGILSGDTLTDRKSVFQAHACVCLNEEEVKDFMRTLRTNTKINRAAHNIMAYRIITDKVIAGKESEIHFCEHDSDGETSAGRNLQELINMMDVRNVCVVVTRWYGGIHLGSDRFKHINNCARTLLTEKFPDFVGGGQGKKTKGPTSKSSKKK